MEGWDLNKGNTVLQHKTVEQYITALLYKTRYRELTCCGWNSPKTSKIQSENKETVMHQPQTRVSTEHNTCLLAILPWSYPCHECSFLIPLI